MQAPGAEQVPASGSVEIAYCPDAAAEAVPELRPATRVPAVSGPGTTPSLVGASAR
jgi:hypothetical protein